MLLKEADTSTLLTYSIKTDWIPACAGMTEYGL